MDEQQYEYRTGRTEPRPKHNSLVSVLLILVIFLCGLVSVLGIMNIRLFRMLDSQGGTAPLSFSQQADQAPASTEDAVTLFGMTIQEIPAIYQSVYDLPAGLFIAHVQDGTTAAALGILAGDVLVSISGTEVTSLEALRSLLASDPAHVTLAISRNGQTDIYGIEVH